MADNSAKCKSSSIPVGVSTIDGILNVVIQAKKKRTSKPFECYRKVICKLDYMRDFLDWQHCKSTTDHDKGSTNAQDDLWRSRSQSFIIGEPGRRTNKKSL